MLGSAFEGVSMDHIGPGRVQFHVKQYTSKIGTQYGIQHFLFVYLLLLICLLSRHQIRIHTNCRIRIYLNFNLYMVWYRVPQNFEDNVSYESFSEMGLPENLLRGIYQYGNSYIICSLLETPKLAIISELETFLGPAFHLSSIPMQFCLRSEDTFHGPSERNCPIMQGSECCPSIFVWNNCDTLLWSSASAWLCIWRMPGFDSCTNIQLSTRD